MIRPSKKSPREVARLALALLDMDPRDVQIMGTITRALAGDRAALADLGERVRLTLGWEPAMPWPTGPLMHPTPTNDDLPDFFGPDN